MASILTDLTAFAGLVFGLSGFILSVLNYRRDRPRVVVSLQWDMEVLPGGSAGALTGLLRVTNAGRRPVYVSHAALRTPTGYLVLMDGIAGATLSEGDPPKGYPISQAELGKHAAYWREVRAQVSDSTGRVWLSERIPRKRVPSWAKLPERSRA